MNLIILDKWIFIVTFAIIVLTQTIVIQVGKKQFLIDHSSLIAKILAFSQLIVWLAWNISNLLIGGYFHLLMTDLCPLISFVSIFVFFAHKERYYKMLMPWLLIGALVTAILGGGEFSKVSVEKGIFLYLRHTLMFVQALLAYIWIKPYNKKELLEILIFPFALIIWILIGALIPWLVTGDERWAIFSTGMLPPSYHVVEVSYGNLTESYGSYALMGNVGWPYPLPTIVFYTIAILIAYVIALSKKYFKKYHIKIMVMFKKTQKI